MLGQSDNEEGSDRACQGASPNEGACNLPATVHCIKCDLWFCDIHAEDEQWHACMQMEAETGGEPAVRWFSVCRYYPTHGICVDNLLTSAVGKS